jgi:hypothetical protein
MATPKPPKQKKPKLPSLDTTDGDLSNPNPNGMTTLNLGVPVEWKHNLKLLSVYQNKSMTELIKHGIELVRKEVEG